MAAIMLFKLFKRKDDSPKESLVTKKEAESADRAVAKVLEVASKEQPRGKYNFCTDEQRAAIGKCAFENRATAAAKHFSKAWDIKVMNQPLGN